MRSAERSDFTGAAAIRSASMRLFAARGFAGVTVRDIAAAAEVSPALVIHHFGSKEGLRAAVDDHVLAVIEELFAFLEAQQPGQELDAAGSPFVELLTREPEVMSYVRRLLVDGGDRADDLFRRLHAVTLAALAGMRAAGMVPDAAEDDDVLAAFLLVNDLGVIILREQIVAATGADPLAAPGVERWARTVLSVYSGGGMSS